MQICKQLLFDFALNSPIKFYIQRRETLPVEIWDYQNVLGVAQRGTYVVLTLGESASFIPMSWVVKVEQ